MPVSKPSCCGCIKPPPGLSIQQARALYLANQVVTPVCPNGYHWDNSLQSCVKNTIPPPPASWNCTPIGCVNPGDGSGQYLSLADCQASCPFPPTGNVVQFIIDESTGKPIEGEGDGRILEE